MTGYFAVYSDDKRCCTFLLQKPPISVKTEMGGFVLIGGFRSATDADKSTADRLFNHHCCSMNSNITGTKLGCIRPTLYGRVERMGRCCDDFLTAHKDMDKLRGLVHIGFCYPALGFFRRFLRPMFSKVQAIIESFLAARMDTNHPGCQFFMILSKFF